MHFQHGGHVAGVYTTLGTRVPTTRVLTSLQCQRIGRGASQDLKNG